MMSTKVRSVSGGVIMAMSLNESRGRRLTVLLLSRFLCARAFAACKYRPFKHAFVATAPCRLLRVNGRKSAGEFPGSNAASY